MGKLRIYVKQIIIKIFLIGEVCLFMHIYFFGKNGIEALQNHAKIIQEMNKNVVELQNEIVSLESDIIGWKTNDFFKEEVARKQLQMARKDDAIFYIGSQKNKMIVH